MSRFTSLAVTASLLLPVLAYSQNPPRVFQAPREICDALDLKSAVVQELVLPPVSRGQLTVRMSFGGRLRTLRLRPYDIRTEDYALLVDDGTELREVPAPPSVTYRGELAGEPDSAVAATFVDGKLRAELRSAGKNWSVHPVSDAQEGLLPTAYVIYERADRQELPFYECATANAPAPGAARGMSTAAAAEDAGNAVAELAVDVDFPFYRSRGRSVIRVQDEITGLLNAVDVIYNREVGIEHRVTTIIVRTVPVYAGGDGLLSEFRDRWLLNHGNIQRDVAHLFSGGPNPGSVIGRAFLNGICSTFSSYGMSWTNWSGDFSRRVDLTAHELGHNWGAGHCDGTSGCAIMCSTIQGCFGVGSFGLRATQAIESFKSSRSCLQIEPLPDAAPVITSISPGTAASYDPETVTITGDNLDMITSLTVGGVAATVIPISQDVARFVPPFPLEIATIDVIAENAIGSSSIGLTIEGIHPSVIDAPFWAIRGVPTTLRIYTDRQWQGVLVASVSNVPSILPGVVRLGLGNNFLELVSFPVFADTRGVMEFEVIIPVEVSAFLATYWQAVTFADSGSLTFPVETSNLHRIVVF